MRATSSSPAIRSVAPWLIIATGCVTPTGGAMPPAAPAPPRARVLLCATWMDEALAEDLARDWPGIERVAVAARVECQNAEIAARLGGDACRDAPHACATPEFVDGRPMVTPASPYDLVLLAEGIEYSRPDSDRTAPTPMKAPFAEPIPTGIGQRQPGGSDETIQKTDEAQRDRMIDRTARPTRSADDRLRGDVYLFTPRRGQLAGARRFEGAPRDRVRSAIEALIDERR